MPQRTPEQLLRMLVDSQLMQTEDATELTQELKSYDDLKQKLVERNIVTAQQLEALDGGDLESLLIGQYRIEEILGSGGMGVVFRAVHLTLNRQVALKIVARKVGQEAPEESEARLQRFHREAQLLARLQHPHIAMAYDAACEQGLHYLVMEFVRGEDLTQRVRNHGVMTIPEAISIIYQAASGLSYAHQNGIIHRDIKPSNLILDEHGVIKVLDCGLAKIIHSVAGSEENETALELTHSGSVVGTANYMSPEQAEQSNSVDERSDIYSLGCTFWYLLTGEAVYQGESAFQTMLHHRERPIPDLSTIRDEADAELQSIFERMLAKRPDDRFQSMSEVVEALKNYFDSRYDEDELPMVPALSIPAAGGTSRIVSSVADMSSTQIADPKTKTHSSAVAAAGEETANRSSGSWKWSRDRQFWRITLMSGCLLVGFVGWMLYDINSTDPPIPISAPEENQSSEELGDAPEAVPGEILKTFDQWNEGQEQFKLVAPISRQASSRSHVKLPDDYLLEVEMIRSGAPGAEYDLAGTTHFEMRIGNHFLEFYMNNGGDEPINNPSNGFLFLDGVTFAHRRELSTPDIVKERWLREHEVDRVVFEVHADEDLGTGRVIVTINGDEKYHWSGELSSFETIAERFGSNSYQWDLILNQWNGTCVIKSVQLQDLSKITKPEDSP
ncbi:MAG: serine/threonine protein kinase [Planctomycetaceae bacterium]|nr:serine/threonine protein kinase [Planctomycetaceae bacterium]